MNDKESREFNDPRDIKNIFTKDKIMNFEFILETRGDIKEHS
jgi:hypothetical protein